MPTIEGDTGLFIDGLPNDKQPGLFVRRVNGKALSDDDFKSLGHTLIKNGLNFLKKNFF